MTSKELFVWLNQGEGQKLWDELYETFNLKGFPAGDTGTTMGGWFNKEILSVDDLQGLRGAVPAQQPGVGRPRRRSWKEGGGDDHWVNHAAERQKSTRSRHGTQKGREGSSGRECGVVRAVQRWVPCRWESFKNDFMPTRAHTDTTTTQTLFS